MRPVLEIDLNLLLHVVRDQHLLFINLYNSHPINGIVFNGILRKNCYAVLIRFPRKMNNSCILGEVPAHDILDSQQPAS